MKSRLDLSGPRAVHCDVRFHPDAGDFHLQETDVFRPMTDAIANHSVKNRLTVPGCSRAAL